MEAELSKVIISCAVTGAVHTRSMSPHLPITADQIATQSIEAVKAGASILHLHARDPETGRPTPAPDGFMQFLPRIKQSTDAVINITTGGGQVMSLDERLAAPLRAAPEQVVIIRSILEQLSMEVATPTEARKVLHLKGADNVGS
jgi:uncharacterized protein (DUF849 family)